MAQILDMPQLSDTMKIGVLQKWRKNEGDKVSPGEVIAEVETDKAMMDFEAFDEGVLLKRLVADGASVPVGTPIAIIGKAGDDISQAGRGGEGRASGRRRRRSRPRRRRSPPSPRRAAKPAPAPAANGQAAAPAREARARAARCRSAPRRPPPRPRPRRLPRQRRAARCWRRRSRDGWRPISASTSAASRAPAPAAASSSVT